MTKLQSAPLNQLSLEELINRFELSPTRLDRIFQHVGNERFNASTAVGLLHGRQIFCFPWIGEAKNILSYRLGFNSALIKQQNGITIIPVQSASVVEEFADEVIYLN
ncbi:hypothetical protein A8990_10572 [Paenibacillus taihuensis]|uniref:Uncharacterized protein n=1 Tax=Paenibacillus taihuensis TaxID=1156355 RepID=A0A3D9SBV3_9BACL|nr:hypothetical protein [Paenibacillus taihuensis]REE91367.1 hypothetical protein A8990_10572 [Paenibacillus taihuensis]